MPPAARGITAGDLIEEIDNKLLPQLTPAMTSDPVLLAVYDLQHMRVEDSPYEGAPGAITRGELEAQRRAFARRPELFAHLLAVHAFYVERAPAAVPRLIAADARPGGYLWFSRQMLRALAMERTNDAQARAAWVALVPGATLPFERPAVELGLAMHDERHGALARVFAAGSPIRSPSIREILLINSADAALLRQQSIAADAPMHEREVALFVLLWKQLSRGRYREFLGDLARVPADAPNQRAYELRTAERAPLGLFTRTPSVGDHGCPSLAATAAALARRPATPRARLCLAEFVRVNDFDGFAVDRPPSKDELGGAPSLFAGPVYHRGDTYAAIIADARAPAADRAYALFRAVRCYAPARISSCGGEDVPEATRKGWFTTLKRDYPRSRWAEELDYWW